jgi:hypothetical protein
VRLRILLLIVVAAGCSNLSGLSGGGDVPDASIDATSVEDGGADVDGGASYAAVVLSDQPIAYYPLDETTGNTVASAVSGAPPGTFTHGVTLGQTSPVTRNTANRAAAFDTAHGADSDLAFGDVFSFPGTAPFSIELWVMPGPTADDGKYRHIFSKCDRDPANIPLVGWNLVAQGTTPLTVWTERIADGGNLSTAHIALALNVFTHIVGVYDGSSLFFYSNGGQSAGPNPDLRTLTKTVTSAFVGSANGGSTGNGHAFVGLIDEIAIYDKALAPDRIAAHYAAGKP